ncbi:MAG: Aminoacetone oxidase family FAD-binding enzyme [Firmicutes bacterium]|nr:Aminoacetone oxidase family FAD-binding enzyme [Bacillota bacterium]
MIAAATAASRGLPTVLLEKNEKLGKKIYITGKGRCNLTNYCDPEEVINNTPGNGSFLYSAIYSFNHNSIMDILNSMGVPTKVERGNRVFPVSDKSSDVIRALEKYMNKYGVEIRLNTKVSSITAKDKRIVGIYTAEGEFMEASSVIVATGGMSYPSTGSTGDGYRWAEALGHTIIPAKPSLVPMETREAWVRDVQGLSLRNVRVTAMSGNDGKLGEEFGEMMFTHFGVSGPVILTLSRYVVEHMGSGVRLIIDLKPALDIISLDRRILRDFEVYANKQLKNALNDLLPQKLIPVVIKLSEISPEKPVNQITRDERQKLANAFKGLVLNIKSLRPIKEAVITAGGVCTKEIEPSTMESRIVDGLFFAGEIIDVDALTGGFNLQIAFSTGYLAGLHCR